MVVETDAPQDSQSAVVSVGMKDTRWVALAVARLELKTAVGMVASSDKI